MNFRRTIALFAATLASIAVLPAFSSSSTVHADDWDDRWEDYWEDREDYYEDLREAREDYYDDLEDLYEDRDNVYMRRYYPVRRGRVRYHTAGYRGYARHGYIPARGCCHVGTYRPAPVRTHHYQGCCTPAPQTCCRVID